METVVIFYSDEYKTFKRNTIYLKYKSFVTLQMSSMLLFVNLMSLLNKIYTLTGHFIRYTLLVPGWTPFCLQNCLIFHGIDSIRCWKHSSEILVHIDMIATQLLQICRLHIHDAISRSTNHKVLYWIEIW